MMNKVATFIAAHIIGAVTLIKKNISAKAPERMARRIKRKFLAAYIAASLKNSLAQILEIISRILKRIPQIFSQILQIIKRISQIIKNKYLAWEAKQVKKILLGLEHALDTICNILSHVAHHQTRYFAILTVIALTLAAVYAPQIKDDIIADEPIHYDPPAPIQTQAYQIENFQGDKTLEVIHSKTYEVFRNAGVVTQFTSTGGNKAQYFVYPMYDSVDFVPLANDITRIWHEYGYDKTAIVMVVSPENPDIILRTYQSDDYDDTFVIQDDEGYYDRYLIEGDLQ